MNPRRSKFRSVSGWQPSRRAASVIRNMVPSNCRCLRPNGAESSLRGRRASVKKSIAEWRGRFSSPLIPLVTLPRRTASVPQGRGATRRRRRGVSGFLGEGRDASLRDGLLDFALDLPGALSASEAVQTLPHVVFVEVVWAEEVGGVEQPGD